MNVKKSVRRGGRRGESDVWREARQIGKRLLGTEEREEIDT